MNDRSGFFAVCADSLTEMCFYYVVAGILILSGKGWGLHLVWLLAYTLACSLLYTLILRKPRTVPFLTVLTVLLVLAGLLLFSFVSATPLFFGYGVVLAVGAGMAVGLPFYYTLHRPTIFAHLCQLDVLIVALLVLLLTKDAIGIDNGTIALTVLIVLLDAAAAVGLRMTEGGGDASSAFRASVLALCSALLLFLLTVLFTLLFSRSGKLTAGILHVLQAFFAAVGTGIEHIFRAIAAFFAREESYEAISIDEMPTIADIEGMQDSAALPISPWILGILLTLLVLGLVAAVALLFRKHTVSRTGAAVTASSETDVRRSGGTVGILWQKLRTWASFRLTAFLRRNTPAGLLVILERKGRRARMPRLPGESMRAFISRMAPDGSLLELADALDLQYYGGGTESLSEKRCRELRKIIRKHTAAAASQRIRSGPAGSHPLQNSAAS